MLPQKHSERLLKIVSLYGKPTIRFWAKDLLRKMEIERKTNPPKKKFFITQNSKSPSRRKHIKETTLLPIFLSQEQSPRKSRSKVTKNAQDKFHNASKFLLFSTTTSLVVLLYFPCVFSTRVLLLGMSKDTVIVKSSSNEQC